MAEETKVCERGNRKSRVGQVVSDVQNKTCIVQVITRIPHKKYKKVVKVRKTYYVHDEENKAKNGDMVRIAETRPLSKLKRWRLVEIVSRPE